MKLTRGLSDGQSSPACRTWKFWRIYGHRKILPIATILLCSSAVPACGTSNSEPAAVASAAVAEQERPETTATIDSASALTRAIDKVFGAFAVEMEYNVMTVRRDSLGYLVRFSIIDPPGAAMSGAPGVVRVCNDGSVVIKSGD